MRRNRHPQLWRSPTTILALLGANAAYAQGTTRPPAQSSSPSNVSPASVTIDKPQSRTVAGGGCNILSDGTVAGSWGPDKLPTLGFTIGPHATMSDEMHASKTPFIGPGYPNEIMAVYLGKIALVDSYVGLGTVVVNADGRTGSFVLNDGKAASSWNCGRVPGR